MPLSHQQAITLLTILVLFIAIYREWIRPALGFFGGSAGVGAGRRSYSGAALGGLF